MRRPEAYHKIIKIDQHAAASPSPGSIPSIHELTSLKPSVVGKRLIYDRCPRWSFRDHLLTPDTTLDQFESSNYAEIGGFSHKPYQKIEARTNTDGIVLAFQHTDMINDLSLTAKKVYTVSASDAAFTVQYAFSNGPEQTQSPDQNGNSLLWGVELNLTLLAGSDPRRYYSFPGRGVEEKLLNSRGVLEDVTEAHLIDEWQGVDICLEFKPAARLWRFPIETISQSEEGLESNYQGSCIVILWPLTLPLKGKQERLITMKISGQ
jgi:alpha-amylase